MQMHNPDAPAKIAVVGSSASFSVTTSGNIVTMSGFTWGDIPEFNYEKIIEWHRLPPTPGVAHSVSITLPSVPAAGDLVWVTLYIGDEKYFIRYYTPTPAPALTTPIVNYIANRIQSLFGQYVNVSVTGSTITITAKNVGEPFGIAYSSHWTFLLNAAAAPSVGQPQNLIDLGVPTTVVNTATTYVRYDIVVDFDSPSTSNVHASFTRWSPVERRLVFTIFVDIANGAADSTLSGFLTTI